MQMTPQESAVGPTPSLPSARTLFAAMPNEVLLELLGARSMHTEKERCWRGVNPGPLVIGALAMGYDDTDPGRVALWSPSAKARLLLDMLIQTCQNNACDTHIRIRKNWVRVFCYLGSNLVTAPLESFTCEHANKS